MPLGNLQASICSVMVTGSCGFIGANLVRDLLRRFPNIRVCGVDRLDYNAMDPGVAAPGDPAERARLRFVRADICDRERMLELLRRERVELLLHLAAQSHVDRSLTDPDLFLRDNVQGTLSLLQAARDYGELRAFLHFSTDEVYGDNRGGEAVFTETSPLNPTNPYSATKAAAEMLVNSFRLSHQLPVIVTRCNNVYGPMQYRDKLIPRCIERLRRGAKCLVHGSGEQTRSFLHVRDVCEAVVCVLERGELGQVYNIGSPREISVLEVIEALAREIRPRADPWSLVEHVRDRPYNDQSYRISIDRLLALGWREAVSFEEGIAELARPVLDARPEKTV